MAEHEIFYMVWNEQGRNPTFKHMNYEAARDEAKRLSNEHPGMTFHVLQSKGHFYKPPDGPQWSQHGDTLDDGIPF